MQVFAVAVVEDNKDEMDALIGALRLYENETGKELRIATFNNAEKFLYNYKPVYDIVFMDIELSGMDGMTAAGELRKYDKNVNLIFATNMAQYAIDGYKVGALDYFVKPVSYYDIKMRMQRIANSKKENGKLIKISVMGAIKVMPVSDILYIEILNHILTYHTVDGKVSIRGESLSKLEKKFYAEGFARCSSSYLVNLEKCSEINSETIKVGKEELRLTRGMRENFIARFAEVCANRGL